MSQSFCDILRTTRLHICRVKRNVFTVKLVFRVVTHLPVYMGKYGARKIKSCKAFAELYPFVVSASADHEFESQGVVMVILGLSVPSWVSPKFFKRLKPALLSYGLPPALN